MLQKPKYIFYLVIAVLALSAGAYGIIKVKSIVEHVLLTDQQLARTEEELLGYTKYTDYIANGKASIQGDAKLLTAKISQRSTWVENVTQAMGPFNFNGTVVLELDVEYAFGYDLNPSKYDLTSEKNGLVIRVGKPFSVTTPSIHLVSWQVVNQPLIGPAMQAAALGVLQNLAIPTFRLQAKKLADSEEVRALCEKKLIEHLTGFLEKQPGVHFVPKITVQY